jgi:hypothetical protein
MAYTDKHGKFFGPLNEGGNVAVLHVEDGLPATRLDASVYPILENGRGRSTTRATSPWHGSFALAILNRPQMYQDDLRRTMRGMEEMMVRHPYKLSLAERVELLTNAATLLQPQTPATPRERKRLKEIREEVCVSLVVQGYKQSDDGSWYQPPSA